VLSAYVAPSLEPDRPLSEVEAFAARLGLPCVSTRPLPTDAIGLIVAQRGLLLMAPGHRTLAWHAGFAPRRVRDGAHDALVRALDLHPGERVLDATLGFGHDTYVLLEAGARVLATEVHPALAWFADAGLRAALPDRADHLEVRCAEAETTLSAGDVPAQDHVYIDPLFPDDTVVPNAMWAPLRQVGARGRTLDTLLRLAWSVARRRVVLKLAPGEPLPCPEGLPAPIRIGSKRTQYACFVRASAVFARPSDAPCATPEA